MLAIIFFVVAGFVFGFAIPSRAAWLALIFPAFFAITAALSGAIDLLLAVITIVLTAVAVVAGRVIGRDAALG